MTTSHNFVVVHHMWLLVVHYHAFTTTKLRDCTTFLFVITQCVHNFRLSESPKLPKYQLFALSLSLLPCIKCVHMEVFHLLDGQWMRHTCRSFLSSFIAHGCMGLNPMIQMVNQCANHNVTIVLRWLCTSYVLIRCMSLMWSLFLIGRLCLSGIWEGLWSRMDTKQNMHYNEIRLCTPNLYIMHSRF